MYYLGRLMQIVGLGLTGLGCVVAFDRSVTERSMWTFALAGLVLFYVGHWLIPKR